MSIELVDLGGWTWSNRGDFNSEINKKACKWNILDLLGVVCKLIYPSMPRECEGAVSEAVTKVGQHTGCTTKSKPWGGDSTGQQCFRNSPD